ncbi:protein phosphatase 1H [Bradysia coprophila]|uniref:protein phosphatase 1H n=1 Tax=Bradysia coprophila TaxID=38358 RepID=UPI00187DC21D|nr:protein phosphatase 1H [Bradysia coprophila]
MFNRIKNRVLTAVSPDVLAIPAAGHSTSSPNKTSNRNLPDKFTYARPPFLQLMTQDELKASADHNVRPIIVPRDIAIMPFCTGYAECVNSGKSEWNEDQAAFHRHILSHPSKQYPDLPYIYFGTFDGHAGYGAALAASNQFHYILHEKLVDVIDMLMPAVTFAAPAPSFPHPMTFQRSVSKDELIIGALESAFIEMDALLAEDRDKYRNAGGCTALVTLFIFGKMFVANAGDSRAVLCQRMSKKVFKMHSNSVIPNSVERELNSRDGEEASDSEMHIFPISFSHDHTPDTERPRLMSTGKLNPTLMGGAYVAMEYAKRPMFKDLGQRVLYRQGSMKGWAYKTLTADDLRMPIVTGEGKRSRLLGTIGVTRGFGDHDLRALGSGLPIKPFLSPHPEVNYRDLSKVISIPSDNNEDGDYGILVMATDGLWDVADIESVSNTVFKTLNKYPTEKHRYTMVAQELVAKSRGRVNESNHWRLAHSKAAATVDDISVFVIPVVQYYKEYCLWEKQCAENFDKPANGMSSESSTEEVEIEITSDVNELQPNAVETVEGVEIGETIIDKRNLKKKCFTHLEQSRIAEL